MTKPCGINLMQHIRCHKHEKSMTFCGPPLGKEEGGRREEEGGGRRKRRREESRSLTQNPEGSHGQQESDLKRLSPAQRAEKLRVPRLRFAAQVSKQLAGGGSIDPPHRVKDWHSAQLSSAQLSSAQLSSAQLSSARLGSARLSSASGEETHDGLPCREVAPRFWGARGATPARDKKARAPGEKRGEKRGPPLLSEAIPCERPSE